MRDTLLANAFAACLEDIERGSSLDECLARYPELRAELAPALRTVLQVRTVPEWHVSPEFKATARERMARRVRSRPQRQSLGARIASFKLPKMPSLSFGVPALVRVAAVMLLGLTVISGGSAIASSNTQPDNPLHQLKLATESIELMLRPAGDSRTELLVEILDRRASELLTMLWQDKGDAAQRALVNYQAAVQVGRKILDSYDPTDSADAAFAVQWQEALARNVAVMQGLVDAIPAPLQPILRTAIANTQQEHTWVNDLLRKTPRQLDTIEASPTKAPATSPTPDQCTYTVKRGDSLSVIAKHYNTTWQRLAALNNLSSPDSIQVGQQLSVPCTSQTSDGQATTAAEFKLCPYTVNRGDTLSSIALKYNTTTRLLIATNNLQSADHIVTGQRLSVPCYVR